MNSLDRNRLTDFLEKVQQRAQTFIGYPAAVDYDYRDLYPFLQYSLNNVGDPFLSSGDMHTKAFEREVVQFFAQLFHAPKENHWGYVTGGGSEGNLYALYVARELFPQGIVYYSEATHYSVQKNIHLLNMDSVVIRCQENGEMDYEDLKEMIQLQRQRPVIILANIGTTMTEAKDSVPKIKAILKQSAIKNSYIHCDAALAGVYLSLLGAIDFDFDHGADSIAISGHKFIGSPITCGLVLVRKHYKDRVGRFIPYIGTQDTTVTGSRNGITTLIFWYAIKKFGKEGLLERAKACLALSDYTVLQLKQLDIAAWKNEHALTVVFPQPSAFICAKWQLASENGYSHVICMPGVEKQHIDAFVADLEKERAEAMVQLSAHTIS